MIRNYLGHQPDIADSAWVDDSAVVTGQVALAEDVSVWPLVSVRGDIGTITIGARSNIQDGSTLHITHDSDYAPGGFNLSIGVDVTVGHNVILHGCTIEDECLIGMGSIVLDGAIVQKGALIGAGSVVSPGKIIEGGYLWLGSPAKKIRELNEQEKSFFLYSAKHYVELKNHHRIGA